MFKGLKLPLVIIFIALFLAIPVLFYFYTVKKGDKNGNVQGIYSEVPSKPGVTLRVSSNGGAWDLHQFLCDDRDACLKSLTVGKPWGIVSGGLTQNYEFNIAPNQNWGSQFKYIKIFVRSSWGSMSRDFVVTPLHDGGDVELIDLLSDGVDYTVVLIPLDSITSSSTVLVAFQDY